MRSSNLADTVDQRIVRYCNSELKIKIYEITNTKAHVWTKTLQNFPNELLKEGKFIIRNREKLTLNISRHPEILSPYAYIQ